MSNSRRTDHLFAGLLGLSAGQKDLSPQPGVLQEHIGRYAARLPVLDALTVVDAKPAGQLDWPSQAVDHAGVGVRGVHGGQYTP